MAKAATRHKGRTDPLDVRDGPNDEFRTHFDVVRRAGGGERTQPKIEQLLRTRYIRPEQSEAARRFQHDYLKGVIGHGRSCIDIGTGGGGDHQPSMDRIDALSRHNKAKEALEATRGPRMPGSGGNSTQILVFICVEDMAFSSVALRAGVSDELMKSWVAQLLTVLAGYYADLDRREGRETTVYTQDAAEKRFEPELK